LDEQPDLDRFVSAQDAGGTYDSAVRELRAGRKQTHWMWFVFPQIAGLGLSSTSRRYAIASLAEARAYLAHPLLGRRLVECADIVATSPAESAEAIFGPVDAMKTQVVDDALPPGGSRPQRCSARCSTVISAVRRIRRPNGVCRRTSVVHTGRVVEPRRRGRLSVLAAAGDITATSAHWEQAFSNRRWRDVGDQLDDGLDPPSVGDRSPAALDRARGDDRRVTGPRGSGWGRGICVRDPGPGLDNMISANAVTRSTD